MKLIFFCLVGPLTISASPESILAQQKSNVSFTCMIADRLVNATFLWSRVDGKPLSERVHRNDSSILTIVGVKEEDEGEYLCTVSNEHQTVRDTVALTVYGKQYPVITFF